jgi:hypothetical protein
MVCVEFDPENDLAYICLTKIGPGDVAFSYNCDPTEMSAMINSTSVEREDSLASSSSVHAAWFLRSYWRRVPAGSQPV